jgi:hypothetical protein
MALLSLVPVQTIAQKVSSEDNSSHDSEPNRQASEEGLSPVRQSEFTYRNIVSALTFDKSAEQTYNPYYAMEFEASPRYWTGKHGYFMLDFVVLQELTDSDYTTKKREAVLEDVYAQLGLEDIWRIPVLGIDVTTVLRFQFPASKVSRARTLLLAIMPRLILQRRFEILEGLSLGYAFSFKKHFHEYTTAQNTEPLIWGGLPSSRTTESFMNTGELNVNFEIANTFGLALDLTEWLGAMARVWIINGFLYDLEDINDDRISYEPQETDQRRYNMLYIIELYARPMPSLEIGLGVETANPALSQDSPYETPYINRYTAIYLDLRLGIEGLITQIMSAKGKI